MVSIGFGVKKVTDHPENGRESASAMPDESPHCLYTAENMDYQPVFHVLRYVEWLVWFIEVDAPPTIFEHEAVNSRNCHRLDKMCSNLLQEFLFSFFVW